MLAVAEMVDKDLTPNDSPQPVRGDRLRMVLLALGLIPKVGAAVSDLPDR